MADRSPIFNPPQDRITDNDPMVVRVPMGFMPWGARKSINAKAWNQKGQSGDADGSPSTSNLPNGR